MIKSSCRAPCSFPDRMQRHCQRSFNCVNYPFRLGRLPPWQASRARSTQGDPRRMHNFSPARNGLTRSAYGVYPQIAWRNCFLQGRSWCAPSAADVDCSRRESTRNVDDEGGAPHPVLLNRQGHNVLFASSFLACPCVDFPFGELPSCALPAVELAVFLLA